MSPTFEGSRRFYADFATLSPEDRVRFRAAAKRLAEDLRSGAPRPGLRVKGVQAAPGVFEMTWAPDGRATFSFEASLVPGEPHVKWRRCGSHSIFRQP